MTDDADDAGGRPVVGKRIALLRRQKEWSQADLADRADVSPMLVWSWESGAKEPEASDVAAVARALGVSVDHLLAQPARRREATEHVDRWMAHTDGREGKALGSLWFPIGVAAVLVGWLVLGAGSSARGGDGEWGEMLAVLGVVLMIASAAWVGNGTGEADARDRYIKLRGFRDRDEDVEPDWKNQIAVRRNGLEGAGFVGFALGAGAGLGWVTEAGSRHPAANLYVAFGVSGSVLMIASAMLLGHAWGMKTAVDRYEAMARDMRRSSAIREAEAKGRWRHREGGET